MDREPGFPAVFSPVMAASGLALACPMTRVPNSVPCLSHGVRRDAAPPESVMPRTGFVRNADRAVRSARVRESLFFLLSREVSPPQPRPPYYINNLGVS
ncbi:hypothetical protein CAL14_10585 [Bordetella genomosp. 9]|nr:hypothetical protein CAL14_10585 [Bordetella genomosp. 9]